MSPDTPRSVRETTGQEFPWPLVFPDRPLVEALPGTLPERLAILAGCGSHGGSGGASSGTSPSETPTASPVWSPSTNCTPLVPPNLSVFQAQVFNGGCLSTGIVTCHTGSTPASSLALTSGLTLVQDSNIASVEIPSMKRIAPGSRADSYFYLKLIDDPVIHTVSGLSYPMLIDRLIALALARHAEKQQLRTSR